MFILIHDRFQFKTFCAVKLIMWGKMLLLINAAINWSHQLFRPLMFWWITGKEIFELKLSDVVYLLSVPIKNHYFLMWISDSLKREEVRWWWGEVGLLDHYDELHRLVDYWNMCLSYVALIHTYTHTHTSSLSLFLSILCDWGLLPCWKQVVVSVSWYTLNVSGSLLQVSLRSFCFGLSDHYFG